jgi:glutathione synthetase
MAKRKKNRLLWITDPWDTLDHPRDTTLRLAEEGLNLGIEQYWCDVKSIRLEGNLVCLDASQILSVESPRAPTCFEWGEIQTTSPDEFTSLHYRTDPPVDHAYLHPLQLLALGLRNARKCEVVNPLEILFQGNEKIEAATLSDLMPPCLVSSHWERLQAFGKNQGKTVLKPLFDAQSHGIELLDWSSPSGIEEAEKKLNLATSGFQAPVMLQMYLKGISEGELRLWFVDGKLLAAVKKHPITGDFRVNMDQGSRLSPVTLSKSEKLKASRIARHLRSRKIRLAAVDLIEGYVTDFNFTSPGLIPLMEDVLNKNLSRSIMKALAG